MKCKDCDCAVKGFFEHAPAEYVCTGVPEPFIIGDPNVECTEYPEKREEKGHVFATVGLIPEPKIVDPYVDDDGIYVPYEYNPIYHKLLISRELFVEAYNKWIKNSMDYTFVGQDDADDWSED